MWPSGFNGDPHNVSNRPGPSLLPTSPCRDHARRASRALMKMHAFNVCMFPCTGLFARTPAFASCHRVVLHQQRTGFVSSSFTSPLKLKHYHNSASRRTENGTSVTMMTSGRRPGDDNNNNDDDDDDDDDDMVVSRRVFLAGTAVSSLITATMSYRFFVGDDVDLEIRRRLSEIAPVWLQSLSLSPKSFISAPTTSSSSSYFATDSEGSPSTSVSPSGSRRRRAALDEGFARLYFDTLERVAIQQGIVSSAAELHKLEEETKRLAKPLFFPSPGPFSATPASTSSTTTTTTTTAAPVRETLGDERWFNFVLYARLRVLSRQSSPLGRCQLSSAVATATLPSLLSGNITNNSNAMQSKAKTTTWLYATPQDADTWLQGLDTLLQSLVSKGWMSSFRLNGDEEFDTTTWMQEHRGVLSVYAYDVVSMQTCQLIAEEMYEEAAPKISGWVQAFLQGRCGVNVSKEDYYLDEVYRADATKYRPTVLATEMDLSFEG